LILTGNNTYTGKTVLWGTLQVGDGSLSTNGRIDKTSNVELREAGTIIRF
jgi:hypothetical protein